MKGFYVIHELERTWTEAALAYFKVLSRVTGENTKNSVMIAGI
jgi:hypothetical protein